MIGLGFTSEQEIQSTFLNDWYLYKHQIVLPREKKVELDVGGNYV